MVPNKRDGFLELVGALTLWELYDEGPGAGCDLSEEERLEPNMEEIPRMMSRDCWEVVGKREIARTTTTV